MSSNRIRFNRTVFSAPLNGGHPREFVEQLAAEDIELIIDTRPGLGGRVGAELDALCEEAEIYYEPRAELSSIADADVAWAARLALRHRTCIIGDPEGQRLTASRAVADLVGMRVIDIEASPAPITDRAFRERPPRI